jgi:hypothetical protein
MASPLEQPPPPSGPVGSPGKAGAPPPSLQSLAGVDTPGASGDGSIRIVMQHLMEAEAALTAAAAIKPELSGILSAFNNLKPQFAHVLFSGGSGPGSGGPGSPGGMPSGGSILASLLGRL